MKKQLLISTKEQVESYRNKIINVTNSKINGLFQGCEGIELLKKNKFTQSGFDPLFDEPLNFIEMTNQVFTYIVCLKAVELLISIHPQHQFVVNFGVESGHDVQSVNESVICECFAVTSPDSNNKLKEDTEKVYNNEVAISKYIIYYATNPKHIHVSNIRKKYQGVEIIALDSF